MYASLSKAPSSLDVHICAGREVGTKATTGARTPETLRSMSSHSVLPLAAMSAAPIVTSAPTNMACTGV
jgi:hypothetical protein